MSTVVRYAKVRVGSEPFGRYSAAGQRRHRHTIPIFAFTAAVASVLVLVFAPYHVVPAAAEPVNPVVLQKLSVEGQFQPAAVRDPYTVTEKIVVVAPAPKALGPAVPAGDAQQIAYAMLQARGMGDDQFACLVSLWNRESHWSTTAGNASGAYGIPQALPGSKMSSAGADWQTNATTQITWGLGYISGRYGTPCDAWAHSEATGWY